MDYYGGDQTKQISNIKILKYMLVCTLILLQIGLLTLFFRHIIYMAVDPNEITSRYLLLAYAAVFLMSSVELVATFKENFFFLITTATLILILASFNMFIKNYRWSIILLQFITSLFTFGYTLSMYFKMKLDILQKKRLQRLEELNSNLKRFDEHIYQIAPNEIKQFDPIQLTNEWIINHRENNNMLIVGNDLHEDDQNNIIHHDRPLTAPTNTI